MASAFRILPRIFSGCGKIWWNEDNTLAQDPYCLLGADITFKFGRCMNLEEVAWNPLDKVECAQPVGKKRPNAWGIYDMHGNVWEWCREKYIHISKKKVISEREDDYIVRGGSFRMPPKYYRAACVDGRSFKTDKYSIEAMTALFKDIGFRIALLCNY